MSNVAITSDSCRAVNAKRKEHRCQVVDVSRGARSCPRDVISEASECFTDYSFHSENMYHSQQKLCCGVDVETLRAFCRSFNDAIRCVSRLKHICPESTHSSIDHVFVNLDGARDSLMELCFDDRFIESYAMHQSCFTAVGRHSESCFHTYLRDSAGIQFLSTVDIQQKEQFCSNMKNVVTCVEKNVNSMCGPAASSLTPTLIKPMVRKSSDCDYSVIKPTAIKLDNASQEGGHYISDQGKHSKGRHSNTHNSNRSGNSGGNDAVTCHANSPVKMLFSAFLSCVWLMFWRMYVS